MERRPPNLVSVVFYGAVTALFVYLDVFNWCFRRTPENMVLLWSSTAIGLSILSQFLTNLSAYRRSRAGQEPYPAAPFTWKVLLDGLEMLVWAGLCITVWGSDVLGMFSQVLIFICMAVEIWSFSSVLRDWLRARRQHS